MRFQAEGIVTNTDLDTVYEIIRDRLPSLSPHLDNVQTIAEVSREDGTTGPKVVNRWRADMGQVPKLAQKVVRPEMLEWMDYAQWHDAEHYVSWRLQSATMPEMYQCVGTSRMHQDGANVRICIDADLSVNPAKIPGVPTFLAKRVLPVLEKYLIERMKPNMASLGTGVSRFLKANES